jgi:hypothetical protein
MSNISLDCWIALPVEREFIRIKSIGRLVSDAVLALHERRYAGLHDADGTSMVESEALNFGYDNQSTAEHNVVKVLLEERHQGRLEILEAEGRGVILDDDVLRGTLRRSDLARLLRDKWNIELCGSADRDGAALVAPRNAGHVPESIAAKREPISDRRRRRLAQFRALGGDPKITRGGTVNLGRSGALVKLVREEAAGGRVASDRRYVKADLVAALKDELNSR